MKKISPINTKKNDIKTSGASDSEAVLNHLFPYHPESTNFTIVCRRDDYSAGRIAHAIEDCNAHVLNLNMTDYSDDNENVKIEVRVDRTDVSSIVRSLERYGMNVESLAETAVISDDDRMRVAELLRYIDI